MYSILSEKGKKLLIVEDFKFYRVNPTKNGVKWRCVQKSCRTKLYVDESDTVILSKDGDHNHSKEEKLVQQMVSNGVKRKATEALCEKPSKIILHELELHPTSVNSLTTKDVYNIRKCIYRSRRSELPPLPTCLGDIHDALSSIEIKTVKEENFLLTNNDKSNMVIFSCHTNLKFLCNSESIYIDGTFAYSPKYFLQMFSIHVLNNGHYIPLVFCLLPNKHSNTYLAIFREVDIKCKELGLRFHPTRILADFEQAIHCAVREMWPTAELLGCRFHLGQSWWRKLQNLGLTTLYKEKSSEVGKWLGWVFGLPFLNPGEVEDCFVFDFMAIQPTCHKLIQFSDYLVDTYISEVATFPPSIWAANIATSERTTNACESFHSRFNSNFYSPHPNIFSFIKVLKSFQTETYIKLNSINVTPRINNKVYKKRLAYIENLVNKYQKSQINRFDFVKCASYHYRK
jgi:hypothetical protein